MPRTTGARFAIISTFGSIVAQDICNNRPPMANVRVCCEIAGKVVRIEARAGTRVALDDTLLLIECMKMEIPVAAPEGGVVEALLVGEGDQVAEGQHVATVRT
jgi:biotin carboxyl carrier protein